MFLWHGANVEVGTLAVFEDAAGGHAGHGKGVGHQGTGKDCNGVHGVLLPLDSLFSRSSRTLPVEVEWFAGGSWSSPDCLVDDCTCYRFGPELVSCPDVADGLLGQWELLEEGGTSSSGGFVVYYKVLTVEFDEAVDDAGPLNEESADVDHFVTTDVDHVVDPIVAQAGG